jgi:hypothetical protein
MHFLICYVVGKDPSMEIHFFVAGTAYEVQLFAGTAHEEVPRRKERVTMSLRYEGGTEKIELTV